MWDLGLLAPVGGSCYQESSGLEVGGVGEPVGGSSEDLEEIICSFDSAIARVVGVVPGEDLV